MFKDDLKKIMKDRGLSVTGLSAATGIGKSSISQYLSGKYEPNEKRKKGIAASLELPEDWFTRSAVDTDVKEVSNLSPKTAAGLMGKSKEFVYQGLRDGVFPWGYAVKMGRLWSYYISPVKFEECTGIKIPSEDDMKVLTPPYSIDNDEELPFN